MPEAASGHRLFHITREIVYNPNAPLAVSAEFEVGGTTNPFFGFYEGARILRGRPDLPC